jgi:predicted permease
MWPQFGDLSYGIRTLRRSPGFALSALLMLAVGLAVNTTVFSWIHFVLLNPLPGVNQPSRLIALVPSYGGNITSSLLSYPDYRALRDQSGVFSGVVGSRYTSALLTLDGRSQWIYGRVVTSNAFDVLGVVPQLGRDFTEDEDQPEGGHPVVIISHALWQRQFSGAREVIGRLIQINQHAFTIIGVAPAAFHGLTGGLRDDFWAPLSMHNEVLQYGSYGSRTFRWVSALARLRPGVSLGQAQAGVSFLAGQLQAAFPDSNKDLAFLCFSLRDSPIGGQAEFRPVLRLLLAVGAGLLLIVFANIANLFLLRATDRRREFAVRAALGASRWRLLRHLVTESILLAATGGILGVAIARWSVASFALLSPPTIVPVGYDFRLDLATLSFVAALTFVGALLCGLTPALAPGLDLSQALKEASRSLAGGRRHRLLRHGLVTCEMALAFVLVIGAGLCLRGFLKARSIELGFDPHNLVSASLSLVPNGYTPQSAKVFDRKLRDQLAAVPGVADVALVSSLPLGEDTIFTATVDVDGYIPRSSEDRQVSFDIISSRYFSTMRIPLLEGRDFTEADDNTAQNVAIVNESMARRYWPARDPLGRRFVMAAGVAPPSPFAVVGVVKDSKVRSLTEPATPLVYLAYQQRPLASLFMGVILRASGNPAPMIPILRDQIHALDPAVEPLQLQTMDTAIQPAFSGVRAAGTFLLVLGAAALFLASLGLYAVTAYAVSCQTREMGIRMALGAQRSHVRAAVLAQGLRLALLGVLLGFLVSLAVAPLLAGFLYGVSPSDPLVYSSVALLLCLSALLGSLVPAVRATQIDPLVALRGD